MGSLYRACKACARSKSSGSYVIGGYDISLEYYTQADIDAFPAVSFGDGDESKIVLLVDDVITIPQNYVLTCASPKKSLVIFCNTFVNNGTVSMTGKGPNVRPHDYCIATKSESESNQDIVVPAYSYNRVEKKDVGQLQGVLDGTDGNSATNGSFLCGSGGGGSAGESHGVSPGTFVGASGSGYAFGGGAGSGGAFAYGTLSRSSSDVDTVYCMHGSAAGNYNTWACNTGGVGNPAGWTHDRYDGGGTQNNFGVGGRIIIFCASFTNNGIIQANGIATRPATKGSIPSNGGWGGSSGGGAVDIFYTSNDGEHQIDADTNITASGGVSPRSKSKAGNGGNGSVNIIQWSKEAVMPPVRRRMTKGNWITLMNEYGIKLKEDSL